MPALTEQQAAAAHSINDNVIVSAGAGSGKTMVLVERFLQVLSEQADATISDIIAVTFTRKAAEEMRSRLKSRLQQISEECPPEEKERWLQLLFQADRARIGTIHSLCESILKSYPIEAQIDPQFEVLDDLTRAELMNEAIEQSLQLILGEPSAAQQKLLEYPIETIRSWILRQLQNIPQYMRARAMMGDDIETIRQQAIAVIEAVKEAALREMLNDTELRADIQYLADNPWPDFENALEARRAEMLSASMPIACNQTVTADLYDAVKQMSQLPATGNVGGAKGKELRGKISGLRSRAKELVERIPETITEADEYAFEILSALLALIDTTIENYENAKAHSQKADYNDLITRTHKLVTAPESTARKQFSERIRALLVDEFQDTNGTQAELLSSLCGSKARLFLIGDDKQSIYKFQGADVSTFNHWKQLMNDGTHGLTGPSQLLDLSYSFRSHPSIVDFVNRFFNHYFAGAEGNHNHHRARAQALIPSRQDEHEASRVEVIVFDPTEADQKRQTEQARACESRAIAAWILEKIAANVEIFDKQAGTSRPIGFGDFAVLVQTNGDFGIIEAALAEAKIPYVTFAGSGFLHRQEIYDIESMLRWLETPENSHALLGVLRSPFFALNDGILHRLCTEFPGSLWKALQSAARQEEFASLQKPLAVLRKLRQGSENSTLSELVRKIITITSYDVVVLSMPNGRQKARNAWKMAAFVQEHDHLSVNQFLDALESMRELGINSHTDAPLSSEASIKLMTIHKSKGLEFPAVILPVLGRKAQQIQNKLLVHQEFGIALDTSRSKDDPRPSYQKAAAMLSAEMEAEEKKRLFYVAMTRARDFLCMLMESSTRSELSFRTWLMQATGIGSDTRGRAALGENEHFVTRFKDKQQVDDWLAEQVGLCADILTSGDPANLAEAIGFDLIERGNFDQTIETTTARLQALRRVTAASDERELEAVSVGRLFHLAMQHYCLSMRLPDANTLATLCLTAELNVVDSLTRENLVSEVQRLLDLFSSQSRLIEMLQTARRVLPEVTYMLAGEQTLKDRRPDLIFQNDRDGWHIVDFKTDRLASTEIANKVNEHSSQVMNYVSDLEQLTGIKATGWLYFAHLGVLEKTEAVSYAIGQKGQLRLPF